MRRVLIAAILPFLSLTIHPFTFGYDFDPEFNLWPIVYYNKNKGFDAKRLEILYPFFEWREEHGIKEFYFRPFYNQQQDREGTRETELFWPFSFSTRSLSRSYKRSFPFYSSISDGTDVNNPDLQETDSVIFPFYFGRSSGKARDFAIFPLFGSFHNRFNRDSVQFLMWPLYSRSIKDDLTKQNFLWPIFSYSRSSEDKGFKVWPFYGRTVESGEDAKKGFIAWPFYVYKDFDIEGVGRYKAWGSLPFYAREESPLSTQTSIIWPFFSHMENPYEGYERWNYFWPLGTFLKGDKRYSNTFLPLWSYHKIGGNTNLSILWPIFWDLSDISENYISKTKRVIPLYWSRHEEWPLEGKEANMRQFWPIFKKQENKDGSSEFQLLSLYIIRAGEESWNRNWGPLFSIFYHYEDPDEEVATTRFFGRLVRYEKNLAYSYFSVLPFFSFQMDLEKESSRYSFLLSMIRYEKGKGNGSLNLLYTFNLPLGKDKHPKIDDPVNRHTDDEAFWESPHNHDVYWISPRKILKSKKVKEDKRGIM